MNCRRADQLFSAAWEDELTLVEREALEAHIESCASCRRSYDEFARVMEAVQGLPKAEPAADFTDAVWSRIHAAERPATSRVRRAVFAGGWSFASFRPALAAAACLVVVGAAVAWWNNQQSESPVVSSRTTSLPKAPAPLIATETSSQRAREERAQDLAASPSRREIAAPVPVTAQEQAPEMAAGQVAGSSLGESPTAASGLAKSEGAALGARRAASPLMLRSGRADALALGGRDSAAVLDSLFNHDYDVEFALDPVHLKRAGKGRLTPARPVPADAQGKPASVTF